MSENEPLPFETVTADEGPSYSSPTSAIDLGAKVMPLRRTKGCLQQLQWHLVSLVCVCMHTCVSQPHVYLPGTTTTSPKVSPLFSLSPPDSDTFPPRSFFIVCHAPPCACTAYRTVRILLYLPHMYMAPPWHGIRRQRASWFAFLSRGGETGFGLFVNI